MGSWDVLDGPEDYDDDILYDDDEDEFGLPSIESMRKRRNVKSPTPSDTQSLSRVPTTSGLAPAPVPPHMRSGSGSFDIAEERNPLSYPSAKKSDGKILRPQYKELLKDPANSLHLVDHPTLQFWCFSQGNGCT